VAVSLTSLNSLQSAVAVAERKVQESRAQVARDEDRLDASRAELDTENQTLSRTQRDSAQAQAAATPTLPTPRLDSAIEIQVPPSLQAKTPTVNTLGQTIGKFIDEVA
jgi:predicted  nucleic acid-binding Zn-ribbon protein